MVVTMPAKETPKKEKHKATFREQVEDVIEKQIRPSLNMDGGDVELLEADEKKGSVRLRLMGACSGCPMSGMTLLYGVERTLKESIPGVREVIPVM